MVFENKRCRHDAGGFTYSWDPVNLDGGEIVLKSPVKKRAR